jgi:hypothetical protein
MTGKTYKENGIVWRSRVTTNVCTVCENWTMQFYDDLGYLCDRCKRTGERCSVKGCENPAVKHADGKCRRHYIDTSMDPTSAVELCERTESPMAECQKWSPE